MIQLKTLPIVLCGALAGSAVGTLALLSHPGRNDLSIVWIWLAMAAVSAIIGSAVCGSVCGTWNLIARGPAR